MEYLDCNGPFLRASNASGGGSELVVDTMPDLLHPNAAGAIGGLLVGYIKWWRLTASLSAPNWEVEPFLSRLA